MGKNQTANKLCLLWVQKNGMEKRRKSKRFEEKTAAAINVHIESLSFSIFFIVVAAIIAGVAAAAFFFLPLATRAIVYVILFQEGFEYWLPNVLTL